MLSAAQSTYAAWMALLGFGILLAAIARSPLLVIGGLLTGLKLTDSLSEPWQAFVSTASTACLLIGLSRLWWRTRAARRATAQDA